MVRALHDPEPLTPPPTGWQATRALMADRRIAGFLVGRFAAAIGFWMERIALGWLVWEATQSPGWVGVLAFVRLMPAVVFGPLGGVWADRETALVLLQRGFLGLAGVLGLLSVLVAAELATLPVLLVMACLSGALQSVTTGPMKAAITEVAPRALLPTAVPVASVTFNAAAFVGPALGGVVLVVFGAPLVFALAALGMILFLLAMLPFPRPQPVARARVGAVRDFAAAMGYARSDPLIGPQMRLHVGFSTLLRPVLDLLPAVAGLLLAGGAEALARLTAAMGLGALVGSIWLTLRSGRGSLARRIVGAAALSCLSALLLSIAPNEAAALVCIAALGAAMVVRAAGSNTIVQLAVDDHMRGRVMALWGTILRITSALGALALGILAEYLGLRATIALAALIAAAILLAMRAGLTREAPV